MCSSDLTRESGVFNVYFNGSRVDTLTNTTNINDSSSTLFIATQNNTTPFGTQLNVYEKGYEFIKHSMFPIDVKLVEEPRVTIGSNSCLKPYSASIFNISAMSYGALSDAAIKALNGGAKLGNFYHNTGEGGLSPYHIENGGDVCFQIG